MLYKSISSSFKILQEDYEELDKNYDIVKLKKENLTIELETLNWKYKIYNVNEVETKERLKNLNEPTVKKIVNYLDLDSYKLVEQIARTVNYDNSAEVIAHMDWWLARNFALRDMLVKNTKTTKITKNKSTWEDMLTWKKVKL